MYPEPIFLNVNLYGISIAAGILLCFLVLFKYAKKTGISEKFTDFIFYTAIAAIVLGFVSASLFQEVYDYIEDPTNEIELFGGGITFIGGLIGGAAIFLLIYMIFRKKYTDKIGDALNIIPCCILLAHAFGRIGCFFVGCCHGGPAEGVFSFLGVVFAPGSTAFEKYGAVPLHPTQLYEAIFLFIMFGVMTWLTFKGKSHGKHNLALYLATYGVFRYFNEMLRADYRGSFVAAFTPSQFWSILMVVLGVAFIILPKFIPALARALHGKYAEDK